MISTNSSSTAAESRSATKRAQTEIIEALVEADDGKALIGIYASLADTGRNECGWWRWS